MTHGHDLLQGRLPRSLASLYDVVGEAVEKAVERGARHLALIHHGDFQKEFFVREEGEGDVWTPRKSDLVEPIERLRNVLGEMSKVNFYRESEGGIEWDKGVTLDID